MSYHNKYLKYKAKYLKLKESIGGTLTPEKIGNFEKFVTNLDKTVRGMINYPRFISNTFPGMINTFVKGLKITDDEIIELLKYDNEKYKNQLVKIFEYILSYEINIFDIDDEKTKFIIDNCGLERVKTCSLDDFFTSKDPSKECINYKRIDTRCSWPYLHESINKGYLSNDVSVAFINLFNAINDKFVVSNNKEKITLGFDIGGGGLASLSKLTNSQFNINLYFFGGNDKNDTVKSINKLTDDIKQINLDSKDPLTLEIRLGYNFPLDVYDADDKLFIDKIIELSKSIYVNMMNNICGTLFRSFWYMNKRHSSKYSYINLPSQESKSEGIRGTISESDVESTIIRVLGKY